MRELKLLAIELSERLPARDPAALCAAARAWSSFEDGENGNTTRIRAVGMGLRTKARTP